MNEFKARMLARDLAECLRLSDARKAENAAQRAACLVNTALRQLLTDEANRRGQALDWADYFRNAGIA